MYHSDKLADLIVVEPLASPTLRLKKEADPFSLDALIGWLEKQPRSREYCYANARTCLLGEYVADFGGSRREGKYWIGKYSHPVGMREGEGLDQVVTNRPHTFGAALDRALALRGDR